MQRAGSKQERYEHHLAFKAAKLDLNMAISSTGREFIDTLCQNANVNELHPQDSNGEEQCFHHLPPNRQQAKVMNEELLAVRVSALSVAITQIACIGDWRDWRTEQHDRPVHNDWIRRISQHMSIIRKPSSCKNSSEEMIYNKRSIFSVSCH